MTLSELERALASKKRQLKAQAQEKASYDYILADLIGRSVARIYNSSSKYPTIEDTYPSLFNNVESEEQKAAKQAELSALRFRQFADAFNKKYKGG